MKSALPGLNEWRRVVDWRLTQIKKMKNVGLYRSSPITAEEILESGAQNIIVATGATWRRDGAFTAALCERAISVLFKTGGGGALFDDHPLQRAFRDVHAATAHISMIWEAQATTFGRVALGLPCDNPTL